MGGAKGLGLVIYRYSDCTYATEYNSQSRINLITTALGQPQDSLPAALTVDVQT